MSPWVTPTGRATRVLVVTLRHGVAHGIRRLLPAWLLPGRRLSGPERLRRLLEELGGVYLKFGQLLSLQPDILPAAYCRALSDLLDRVRPFPFPEVEAVFREALGQAPDTLFDAFEPQPFATASIAQVHGAVLGGRRVAVKVRRPTVGGDFEPDLRLIGGLSRCLYRWGPRRLAWLAGALEELERWTREELDFRHEAAVMAAVRRQGKGRPGEVVPQLEEALSGPRLLVAELLEGPTLLQVLRRVESGALPPEGVDLEAVAGHIVDNFADSAFRRGLFHADLHPANLLILPGSAVGYVDFGIAGHLSLHSRKHLLRMILALYEGDAGALQGAFLKIAVVTARSDLQGLRRGLRRLLARWLAAAEGETPHLNTHFTAIMMDLLALSRATDVWPAPEVLRYIRSVISTDGLIQRFAPGFDVGGRFQAACRRVLQGKALPGLATAALAADFGAAALRRFAAPALTVPGALEETGTKARPLGRPVLQLLLLATGCALAALQHPEPRWGLNLFSVELLAAGASALALLAALARQAGFAPEREV